MIVKALITLVIGYLLLMLFIFLRQDRLLFNAHSEILTTPAEQGLAYEDVRLETADGVTIDAWYVPRTDSPYALLFLHGNSDNLSDIVPTLRFFHRMGLNTLAIDYRGYGRSGGSPSERGTLLDAEAAWNHLLADRGFSGDHVVVLGRSLGGAVAAWLASRHRPAGVVLESTFSDLPTLARQQYPYLPVGLLLRHRYPTIERIPSIEAPILVVHSRDDEVIPFAHAERLLAAIPGKRRLLTIQGRHYDGYATSGETYRRGLLDFFHEVLGPLPRDDTESPPDADPARDPDRS